MFYGGEVLDNTYQIIEEIGTGGTGIVYRAYHLRLKKYVVVKKLKEALINKSKIRIEVDILKSLHHTCLPQVYDFLEINDQVYTIMDYIQGEDLQHYLDKGYVFQEKELVKWLKQMCDVLKYLHGQSPPILHSDIKPGNIMITPQGNVCLIDFNISLGGGHYTDILGLSKEYAAPEQFEKARLYMEKRDSSGIVLDCRMDIYSLGASFYSLMSGSLPDMGSPDFLPLRCMELPYSSALTGIVEKAMEENPARRYASAEDMEKALEYMYKMDESYRKMQRQSWLLGGLSGICIVAGILCCVYGRQSLVRDSYEKVYRAFYESAESYENTETIKNGLDILNEQKYQGILKKTPEDKAQILYSIGNAYYGQEDFHTAETYYEEAIEESPSSVYYRDYVMAAVKDGNLNKAKRALKEAEAAGVKDEELLLAEQEVSFAEGNMEEVVEKASVLSSSKSLDIAGYSCLLGAKAYEALGRYEEQAEYLEMAYSLGKDRRCLRELGSTYLEAARGKGSGLNKEYLRRAENCYEELQKSFAVSYTDQMNLAITKELLEEYEESDIVLKALQKQYPEKYEIYMHLSYSSLKQQELLKKEERDYTKAMDYYNKAETRYRKAGNPTDTAMSELTEYIKMLEGGQ